MASEDVLRRLGLTGQALMDRRGPARLGLALGLAMGIAGGAGLLLSAEVGVGEGLTRYDGLAAVSVEPRSEAERALVLESSRDLWSESSMAPRLNVVMSPEGLGRLRKAGIEYTVVVPDIQAPIDAERARLSGAAVARPSNWFTEYRDYDTVDAYLDHLAETHPSLAATQELGLSTDGRRIRALRITGKGEDRLTMVLNGGQHAREWIGVMVPVCVADRLLRDYASDARVRRVVDGMDIVVVPMVNPDGYEYTWDTDRYWRKNRSGEHGVDLNRNFGTAWGGQGASKDPKSQVYRGPHPFSETETQVMRRLFESEPVDLHVDFHSFSQLILHPWGYKSDAAPDADLFRAAAGAMSAAMVEPHGEPYRIMSGSTLYPASGTFMDWTYGEREALSFVIELRPKGAPGFVLPPEEIIPTCDEAYAGTLALADWKLARR